MQIDDAHPEEDEQQEPSPLEGPQRPPATDIEEYREEEETAAAQQPLPSSITFDSLPPSLAAPPRECDPAVQSRVSKWLELQQQGRGRLTDTLRASKEYRNPEFFRKMIEYWEIDEYGTAFAPEIFNPAALSAEDTIEAMKNELTKQEERKREARAAGTSRIEFSKGTAATAAAAAVPPPQLQQGGGTLTATATAAAVAAAQAVAASLAKEHHHHHRRR